MAFNPQYEGAINRQRQLEAMRGQVMSRVNASPGETMSRMQNRNNTPLGQSVTVPVSMGNAMQQRFYDDMDRAAAARIQYRQARARYLLDGG